MANDWTRLLQEASKRHGPDGLRAFYANRGRIEGISGTLLIIGGVALLTKARQSFARAKDAAAPAADPAAGNETATPGPEDSPRTDKVMGESPQSGAS